MENLEIHRWCVKNIESYVLLKVGKKRDEEVVTLEINKNDERIVIVARVCFKQAHGN